MVGTPDSTMKRVSPTATSAWSRNDVTSYKLDNGEWRDQTNELT